MSSFIHCFIEWLQRAILAGKNVSPLPCFAILQGREGELKPLNNLMGVDQPAARLGVSKLIVVTCRGDHHDNRKSHPEAAPGYGFLRKPNHVANLLHLLSESTD